MWWVFAALLLALVILFAALCERLLPGPEPFVAVHDISGSWGGGDVSIQISATQNVGTGTWERGPSRPPFTIARTGDPNKYRFRFVDTPAYDSLVTAMSADRLTLIRTGNPRLPAGVWTRRARSRLSVDPPTQGAEVVTGAGAAGGVCAGDACSKAACYAQQVQAQGGGPYVRRRGMCQTDGPRGERFFQFRDVNMCKKSQGLWKACLEDACAGMPERECKAAATSYGSDAFRALALKMHNCLRRCGGDRPAAQAALAWSAQAERSAGANAQRVCDSRRYEHPREIDACHADGTTCSENLSGMPSVLDSAFEFYNEKYTEDARDGHFRAIDNAKVFMGCAGVRCANPVALDDGSGGSIRDILMCHYNRYSRANQP